MVADDKGRLIEQVVPPVEPLEVDDRDGGYNLLETAVTTFSTLLKLSTRGDIRRTTTWNRFLLENPEAAGAKTDPAGQDSDARPRTSKRIIPLYRIAPEQREIGTVEFDGHYEKGADMKSATFSSMAGSSTIAPSTLRLTLGLRILSR